VRVLHDALKQLSTYFNPFDSSLKSWQKFAALPINKKIAVLFVTTVATVATCFIGSLATFRLLTEKLSPTDEKVKGVAEKRFLSLEGAPAMVPSPSEIPSLPPHTGSKPFLLVTPSASPPQRFSPVPMSHLDDGPDALDGSIEMYAPLSEEENRAALKAAFAQSSEEGTTALWAYMRGERLSKSKEQRVNSRRAKANFVVAMKKMLGLEQVFTETRIKFQKRVERKLPVSKKSIDACLSAVVQARRVVEDADAPIPKEHYARVLAGATIARIESGLCRYAALKKPAKLQERLNRWKTKIDPARYDDGADYYHGQFARKVGNCSTFTPERLARAYDKIAAGAGEITAKHKNDPELALEYGVAHLRGRRIAGQEDAHAVGKVHIGETTVPFFAICDGHNGDTAAIFVSEKLETTLQELLGSESLETLSDAQLENLLSSVGVRLCDAFATKHPEDVSGTTLTMALILPRNGKQEVWTANVGDSRTLAVISDKTYQLTEDARPDAARFKASCERAGIPVFVSEDTSITGPRLLGRLAVARSIGALEIQPVSKAKITKIEIPENGATLVLNCDGLNEAFSSKDVGDISKNSHFTTPQEKAEAMVRAAFVAESGDNISALVINIPAK